MKIALMSVAALLLLAGCSSGAQTQSAPTAANPDAACLALKGKPVDAATSCDAPISGPTTATAFPCYGKTGTSFYYFNVGSREYVYGLPGGTWQAGPYTQSLGSIASALGC